MSSAKTAQYPNHFQNPAIILFPNLSVESEAGADLAALILSLPHSQYAGLMLDSGEYLFQVPHIDPPKNPIIPPPGMPPPKSPDDIPPVRRGPRIPLPTIGDRSPDEIPDRRKPPTKH